MVEPLSNQLPTGSRGNKPVEINDASLYIDRAPVWWSMKFMPVQVKTKLAYLETLCGVKQFKEHPITGLLLYGPPGTGKTSAGIGLLYSWGQTGRHATFQDFGELMIRIRSSWRKDAKETGDDIHRAMLKPAILQLDDINKRAAPEDQETLSIIINSRMNQGKPTICTTNCDLTTEAGRKEFLATADSRVLERYSNCDINVAGKNLRRQQ